MIGGSAAQGATQRAEARSCLGQPATIVGTPGADDLRGTLGADVIAGLGGNDRIRGLGGDDLLCGDAGTDRLLGLGGTDRLSGGDGDDALSGGAGLDTCYQGKGTGLRSSCELPVALADAVVAAAGDIACEPEDPAYGGGNGVADACRMKATSDLLAGQSFTAVLALGDLQYPDGDREDFVRSYDSTWGRVKAITRPAPGNHEYATRDAAGYYEYWGERAGDPAKGYYSYDIGSWHVIVLNSNCENVACGAASAQVRWLRTDLAAHPALCTLAYWHQPRFSSGEHGSDTAYDAFWRALYAAGADLVLNGHDHDYERFAPQSPAGEIDRRRGIHEFVVGTGGKSLREFLRAAKNSEVRDQATFGVLELTLRSAGFDWQFIPEDGKTFTDSGSGSCH